MRTLTIGQFVAEMTASYLAFEQFQQTALETAAKMVVDESKSELGTYQSAAGGTPDWSPLAPSTQAERVSKGFSADEPLLRSGDLRDSISYQIDGQTAHVGSTSPYSIHHELGTPTIPQRSFLAGAAARKGEDIAKAAGEIIVTRIFR